MSLQVTEEAGRKLLAAVGYKGTATWSSDKVANRLNGLAEGWSTNSSSFTEPEDPENKELLGKILDLPDGEKVTIEGNGRQAKSTQKEESRTVSKTGTAKEKTARQATESESAGRGKGNLDRFGCRIGKNGSKINAEMKAKAQDPDVIAEKCGVPVKTVKEHLAWMVRHGHFVKDDKGRFAIKGE